MKTMSILLALLFTGIGAQAADDAKQIAERNALPQPAPYGAYFLDRAWQAPDEYKAAGDAIARKYGYKDSREASKACLEATRTPQGVNPFGPCALDPVTHRRKESTEIAKFGFASWSDAVHACIEARKAEALQGVASPYGRASYCQADPFLRLRVKS